MCVEGVGYRQQLDALQRLPTQIATASTFATTGITLAGLLAALSIVARKGRDIEEIAADERLHRELNDGCNGDDPHAPFLGCDGSEEDAAARAESGSCGWPPYSPGGPLTPHGLAPAAPLADGGAVCILAERAGSGGAAGGGYGLRRRHSGTGPIRLPALASYGALEPYASVGAMLIGEGP